MSARSNKNVLKPCANIENKNVLLQTEIFENVLVFSAEQQAPSDKILVKEPTLFKEVVKAVLAITARPSARITCTIQCMSFFKILLLNTFFLLADQQSHDFPSLSSSNVCTTEGGVKVSL